VTGVHWRIQGGVLGVKTSLFGENYLLGVFDKKSQTPLNFPIPTQGIRP